MRNYKFRGKRIDNGDWVYGYYYQENIGFFDNEWRNEDSYDIMHMIKIHYGDHFKDFEIDPTTLGQYIGLKDKNGKEIYEGDIVRHKLGVIAKTIYIKEHAAFLAHYIENDNAKYDYLDEGNMGLVEVIGNIFTNPELLEKEE